MKKGLLLAAMFCICLAQFSYGQTTKFQNDLQKANIKGKVTSIVENNITWKRVDTSNFNENGMITRFNETDRLKNMGTLTMEYAIQNDIPVLVKRVSTVKDQFYYNEEQIYANTTVTYTYDPATTLLTEKYDATAKEKTVYKYDKKGRLVSVQNFKTGQDTSPILYTYDASGLTKNEYMGEISEYPNLIWTYDAEGRLLTYRDGMWVTHKYTYNKNGDVIKEILDDPNSGAAPDVITFKYIYDAQGNWTKRTQSSPGNGSIIINRTIKYAL